MTGSVAVVPGTVPGVQRVVLRHPGKLNAMSRAMWLQLRAVFDNLGGDASLRCIVVQGEGAAFCAGGDISEYPAFRFDRDSLAHFHETEVWGALAAMLACDMPMVAAIRGPCMGAGVEIASCCDIRIAGESARFGAPIAKLGFPMAPREAKLVHGAVGDTRARQMLLEAATFGSADMLPGGFLSRCVADGAVDDAARDCAERIAALAPNAARAHKQTLRALRWPELGAATVDPYAYADSAEHREGITAFLAKRPAVFQR